MRRSLQPRGRRKGFVCDVGSHDTDGLIGGLGDLTRFYSDVDGDPLTFEIEVVAPHAGLILFKLDKGFLHTIPVEGNVLRHIM